MHKYRAAYLFDGQQLLEDRTLVTDDEGAVLAILPGRETGEGAEDFPGILCPGFVNAHCHLELSHLRGAFPEGQGLISFLLSVIGHRSADPTAIREAAREAEREMIAGGIVAVGDISNTTDTLDLKKERQLRYHTFVECFGMAEAVAEARLAASREVHRQFTDAGLNASLTAHAPYSLSPLLMRLLGQEQGPASVHSQECADEDALFLGGPNGFHRLYSAPGLDANDIRPTGTRALPAWLPAFLGRERLLLVHNTFTNADDIRYVQEAGIAAFWCLCPNANLYIEKKMPPVDILRQAGCRLCLGTDSLSSNHALSILSEMRAIQEHYPHVPLAELLGWATAGGAAALGWDETLGSFAPGMRPGIVHLHPLDSGPSAKELRLSGRTAAAPVRKISSIFG